MVNKFKYVPAPQESVVGVVTSRSGEGWRVDIGSAHTAYLDGLAFEGATKRNKPNLKAWLSSQLQKSSISLLISTGRIINLCPCVSCAQRHGA